MSFFALAANAEGGMVNRDTPALAQGADEGSLNTYPDEEEELFKGSETYAR